jgi:hypothetical protein
MRSIFCAMVCPCADPITRVRRMSMSSVPCKISPASGGRFSTTRLPSTRMTMQANIHSTRMTMGRIIFEPDQRKPPPRQNLRERPKLHPVELCRSFHPFGAQWVCSVKTGRTGCRVERETTPKTAAGVALDTPPLPHFRRKAMKQQMLGSLLPILAIETKGLRIICLFQFSRTKDLRATRIWNGRRKYRKKQEAASSRSSYD